MCMQFTLHGQGAPSKHIKWWCQPLFRADFRGGFQLWRQDLGPDVEATRTELNFPTHRTLGIW